MLQGAVETASRSARIAGFDGQVREVEIPLAPSAHGGEPTLFEHLNNPAMRFLACRSEGETLWLNLEWIAWVELSQPNVEAAFHVAAGARRAAIVADLVTGETLRAEVVYVPARSDAGLESLLENGERFFLVGDDEGLRLVHRAAVARLRSV